MRSEGGDLDETRSMAATERGDDVGMDQAANVLNSSRSMRQVCVRCSLALTLLFSENRSLTLSLNPQPLASKP